MTCPCAPPNLVEERLPVVFESWPRGDPRRRQFDAVYLVCRACWASRLVRMIRLDPPREAPTKELST